MDWLTAQLDKNFENRFSFLKLLEVKYDKSNCSCLVSFLYPETKTLSDSDKNKIEDYIKGILKLTANLTVKFKKSYLDDNLIINHINNFLKKDYPSAHALLMPDSIKIKKDFTEIEVTLILDKSFLEFIDKDKFKERIKSNLSQNFCAEFIISLQETVSEKVENANLLNKNQEEIFSQKTPRYEVELFRNLFGGDIIPKPEFIKNITQEKSSVILAGKIENFEKKSYESKREKTKGQIKHYFCFDLNDTTAKMEVKYFTSISNEKKMDKLLNGDEVIIMGDIETFNKKLSLHIKAISRCKLPEKIEIKKTFSNDYEVIQPQRFSVLSQGNLFKESAKYSDKIISKTYVVFDVETTGLDYQTDELLEIGAVKIENGVITSTFASLIKPINPIPATATAINNITDSMVSTAPDCDLVIRDFFRFCKNSDLAGYNVGFDQKFIQQAGKKQSINFEHNFVDILPLARAKLKLTRYKLTDVVKRLEIDLQGAHRALADALATAEVFLKLSSSEF